MRILTLGTFDLFHRGHVEFLRRCHQLAAGGTVTVGLNTDRFAATYKRAPVVDYAGREAVLRACRYVDFVLPNDQPDGTARRLIEGVAPTVVAVTMDWHPSAGKDWFEQIGLAPDWFERSDIRLAWIPYTAGVSTTAIAAAL